MKQKSCLNRSSDSNPVKQIVKLLDLSPNRADLNFPKFYSLKNEAVRFDKNPKWRQTHENMRPQIEQSFLIKLLKNQPQKQEMQQNER